MWRFVQLSDTHLASTRDGEWNNRFLCTMMPEVMRCLRGDLAELNPDFILLTGDIANRQTRDAMFAARDLIDSLGFPYYPMGGNHDFVLDKSREWFIEAFEAHLPVPDTVYSFDYKDLHFCVLDPWWKWADDSLCPVSERAFADPTEVSRIGSRWAVPPHQLGWLEDDLANNDSRPTLVALHYPAVPIPKRMQRPGIKDAGSLDNGDLLIEILRRHPHVKAILSGHLHMHFIVPLEGMIQVVTGAMPEFPVEYREFHVYDDRIEIRTCPLSDTSLAARSLIAGKDWTAGEERDRVAMISLT